MTLKVAINGFGRTGRNFLRALYSNNNEAKIEVLAINNTGSSLDAIHSLCYDKNANRPSAIVGCSIDNILINHKKIPYFTKDHLWQIPWDQLEIDWLIDCTTENKAVLYSKENLIELKNSKPPRIFDS